MPRRIRTRRRTPQQLRADAQADALVASLGRALRDARRRAGLTQAEVGRRSAVTQSSVSQMERGKAPAMSLRTWSRVAMSTGSDLRAYLEGASATDQPRDAVHLRTQELIAVTALAGRWGSVPELAIDDAARGSRSLDLWLERHIPGRPIEVCGIEVMDWIEDVGARFRDWDRRMQRVRQRAVATRTTDGQDGPELPIVSGCWVVRATRRNRQLVRDHATLFDARFPGSGRAWLAALRGTEPMPSEPGLLWVDVAGTALSARYRAGS